MAWPLLAAASGIAGDAIGALWNRQNYLTDRAHLEERQDNAVRRHVADLRDAGINPILAAGQGAAASEQGSTPEANFGNHMSIGEIIQMQAAKAERDKTKAETLLLQAQKDNVDAQTEGTNISNQYYTESNPTTIQESKARLTHANMQIEFDRTMNPIRILEEQRQSQGQYLSNQNAWLEKQIRELNINNQMIENQLSEEKLALQRKFGMSNAEADNYLKQAAVWVADNEKMRAQQMNQYVWSTGGTFQNPDGTGLIGQVKQMLGMLTAPFRGWVNPRMSSRK